MAFKREAPQAAAFPQKKINKIKLCGRENLVAGSFVEEDFGSYNRVNCRLAPGGLLFEFIFF